MPPNQNSDQRVTNAVIKQRLDYLSKTVEQWHEEDCAERRRFQDEIRALVHQWREEEARRTAQVERRLQVLEQHVILCQERWEKHTKTHDDMKRENRTGTIVGTAVGIVAAVKAFFFDQ
jgi:hypothetical protein